MKESNVMRMRLLCSGNHGGFCENKKCPFCHDTCDGFVCAFNFQDFNINVLPNSVIEIDIVAPRQKQPEYGVLKEVK